MQFLRPDMHASLFLNLEARIGFSNLEGRIGSRSVESDLRGCVRCEIVDDNAAS